MKSQHSLNGLMKWLQRGEWRNVFEEILVAHFGPACDEFDIEPDDVASLLGAQNYMNLWGCAFEDLLSREFNARRNIIDEYLKRRGWNESATSKAYMAGLRRSVMSLYEVSDIVPGRSMQLRDLLEDREPVTVSEQSASCTLRQWDRIGARVVPMRRKNVLAGGLLPFTHETSKTLREMYQRVRDKTHAGTEKIAVVYGYEVDNGRIAESITAGEVQRYASRLITMVWLRDALQRRLEPGPQNWCNTDGEELLFTTVHYRLCDGVTSDQIRQALTNLPELHQETDNFWNWIQDHRSAVAEASGKNARKEFELRSETDQGTVLGNVELKQGSLTLSANSRSRAERGRALIESVLQDLLQEPLVETQTVEQAMANSGPRDGAGAAASLSPEEEKEAVHQLLARQYRQTLDEPVPMLNDLSPREAARRPETREMVADWLKYLENANARQPAGSPMVTYDSSWMWEELGVSDLRR